MSVAESCIENKFNRILKEMQSGTHSTPASKAESIVSNSASVGKTKEFFKRHKGKLLFIVFLIILGTIIAVGVVLRRRKKQKALSKEAEDEDFDWERTFTPDGTREAPYGTPDGSNPEPSVPKVTFTDKSRAQTTTQAIPIPQEESRRALGEYESEEEEEKEELTQEQIDEQKFMKLAQETERTRKDMEAKLKKQQPEKDLDMERPMPPPDAGGGRQQQMAAPPPRRR